jgi:Pheromone A receptor
MPARFDLYLPLASRFMVGLSVAIPATLLCIRRRLYYISSMKLSAPIDKAEKRRAMVIDLAIGLGIPVLEMTLRVFIYILQLTDRLHMHVQNTSFKDIVSTSWRKLAATRQHTTHLLLTL